MEHNLLPGGSFSNSFPSGWKKLGIIPPPPPLSWMNDMLQSAFDLGSGGTLPNGDGVGQDGLIDNSLTETVGIQGTCGQMVPIIPSQ